MDSMEIMQTFFASTLETKSTSETVYKLLPFEIALVLWLDFAHAVYKIYGY